MADEMVRGSVIEYYVGSMIPFKVDVQDPGAFLRRATVIKAGPRTGERIPMSYCAEYHTGDGMDGMTNVFEEGGYIEERVVKNVRENNSRAGTLKEINSYFQVQFEGDKGYALRLPSHVFERAVLPAYGCDSSEDFMGVSVRVIGSIHFGPPTSHKIFGIVVPGEGEER